MSVVYKCKMCGGNISRMPNATTGVCESCLTKQTLPKTTDDNIANLFNRANNLRLKYEFDRAEKLYETIIKSDDSEAEAHWGLVLCKFGIEYIKDPSTNSRIPTCHRTSFEIISSNPDYQAAIDYSDSEQQIIYESEARIIERLQRTNLSIAKEQTPFDIFICYKRNDEYGNATLDSKLAEDIYYQLVQFNYKVFLSDITLKDKQITDKEPYVSSALNSANFMLVLGTKPEYFNAVWVKNEWARFLQLAQNNQSKIIIPCYRDMDIYDLPEAFEGIKPLDMSRIGFITDLIRILQNNIKSQDSNTDNPKPEKDTIIELKPQIKKQSDLVNIQLYLSRGFLYLENGEWQRADEFFDKVLSADEKNAQAYLGKLMSELKVKKENELENCEEPFEYRNNYKNAFKYADTSLKEKLEQYIAINRLMPSYLEAKSLMQNAKTKKQFIDAANIFRKLYDFRDSKELLRICCKYALNKPLLVFIEIMENLVTCPSGSFLMGSPDGFLGVFGGETSRDRKETQHLVIISKEFKISKYPVTQALYEYITGSNPSKFINENCPVENISWNDAKKFCNKLNIRYASQIPTGYKFDLPTEAQWEYACRAGTSTAFNNGQNLTGKDECDSLDEIAWYKNNADGKTHPVGLKKPNEWGIYDMHGNVYEWCRDWYGDYPTNCEIDPTGPNTSTSFLLNRVIRGGNFKAHAGNCRSAARCYSNPNFPFETAFNGSCGFRIVLVSVK